MQGLPFTRLISGITIQRTFSRLRINSVGMLEFHWLHVRDNKSTPRRIAVRDTRDWRDGRDEVEIQSVHVAPFSPISRFTRHDPWR